MKRDPAKRELSTPPSDKITWTVRRGEELPIQVTARSWFVARARCAVILGCEPGQLLVEAFT